MAYNAACMSIITQCFREVFQLIASEHAFQRPFSGNLHCRKLLFGRYLGTFSGSPVVKKHTSNHVVILGILVPSLAYAFIEVHWAIGVPRGHGFMEKNLKPRIVLLCGWLRTGKANHSQKSCRLRVSFFGSS